MSKLLDNTGPSGLAELHPRPGERLRVECAAPKCRFAAELVGYRVGASVLISAPRAGSRVRRIAEGTPLTVRLMAGNRVCAFTSRLLAIADSPFGYWHLEYPKRVEVRRIRTSTRVPVRLRVAVDSQDDECLKAALPCAGLCTDISLHGACIETLQPVAEPGDALFLTLRLGVAGIDQVMLVPALVRNREPMASGEGRFRFGVEFQELEEEAHLTLSAFVYQQFLTETGYIDDF